MNRVLYIASTYYHALIACVKQMKDRRSSDLLCTDIPLGGELSDRIRAGGLFEKVYYIENIGEYRAKNPLDHMLNLHRKNAEMIEKQLPFSFGDYREINVFHDDIWASRYMKDRRIKYRLLEDALDSFKHISSSIFCYMIPKRRLRSWIKKTFRIGYVFCGYDDCTYEVEVNERAGVEIEPFASKKIKEAPRRELFDRLSAEDIELLKNIFMKAIPEIKPEESCLLLTQPFFADGVMGSEEEQLSFYKKMTEKYLSGEKLVIKPHPRDPTDYSGTFPDAVVLDKNMPVEILELTGNTGYRKVLSVNSTSSGFIKAQKYIITETL
ncbi:MAG: glycosyltransferase family 52 protein [Bacteroides sp.]|nr:glycosyltransferase family 52 protein [Eubacterium sp.]MCM1417978.1 glycosyltransferase family 52 protein [Roseburia sp.]MCM1461775.1 glycosyltransferase family 52 protein [Bacteroides sp.]